MLHSVKKRKSNDKLSVYWLTQTIAGYIFFKPLSAINSQKQSMTVALIKSIMEMLVEGSNQ